MNNIKYIGLANENILVIDNEHKIWVMGENLYNIFHYGEKMSAAYTPVYTGITLDENETVKKFHVYLNFMSIWTNKGKLYISRRKKHKNHKNTTLSVLISDSEPETDTEDDGNNNGSDGEYEFESDTKSDNESDSELFISDIFLAQSENLSRVRDMITSRFIVAENNSANNSNEKAVNTNELNNVSDSSDPSSDSSDRSDHNIRHADVLMSITDAHVMSKAESENSLESIPKNAFFLLEENVEKVVFCCQTIFFKKNNDVYFYHNYLTSDDLFYNHLALSCHQIVKDKISYYKIVFPFQWEKLELHDNFVYFKLNSYHCVISTLDDIKRDNEVINWIYFAFDGNINHNNIYYCPIDGEIYIKYENSTYKYSNKSVEIKNYTNNKTTINKTNNGINNILIMIDDNGLYIDRFGYRDKIIDAHDLLPFVVDVNESDGSVLALMDIAQHDKYVSYANVLFWNIHHIDAYKLMDDGLIYLEDGNLYFLAHKSHGENSRNIDEIQQFTIKNQIMYLYLFNNVPNPINNIMFSNNIVIIKSGDKYYYQTIGLDVFQTDKFTEIKIHSLNFDTVCMDQIIYPPRNYDYEVRISINQNSNKLEKFLNMMEMHGRDILFYLQYRHKSQTISHGDGVTREFMDTALREFAQKYLIKHNHITEFNISEMVTLSEDQLFNMGTMLHAAIVHNKNSLPIRLPISFLAAIRKRKASVMELEYFLGIENPSVLKNASPYKNDLEMIKSFGYDSYISLLKRWCYFYYQPEFFVQTEYISNTLAEGFLYYANVNNLTSMNLPTLDNYVSGEYHINVDLLIENLIVTVSKSVPQQYQDCKDLLVNILRNMTEDKLVILLKNWTGCSMVMSSNKYNIKVSKIKNFDIRFGTCGFELEISYSMLQKEKRIRRLIDMLTEPVESMRD